MEVCIRIPTRLRELTAGERVVSIEVAASATVASVLDALADDHPALERRVRDEQRRQRLHVNLFVGPDNIRDLDGLATPITAGQELSIIPAISGGFDGAPVRSGSRRRGPIGRHP
ncbi:MAG: ubiquitin-like small modifier protein 1 [Acidimicrobiales bacterium]